MPVPGPTRSTSRTTARWTCWARATGSALWTARACQYSSLVTAALLNMPIPTNGVIYAERCRHLLGRQLTHGFLDRHDDTTGRTAVCRRPFPVSPPTRGYRRTRRHRVRLPVGRVFLRGRAERQLPSPRQHAVVVGNTRMRAARGTESWGDANTYIAGHHPVRPTRLGAGDPLRRRSNGIYQAAA